MNPHEALSSGLWCTVTKPSDDGTFDVGDCIRVLPHNPSVVIRASNGNRQHWAEDWADEVIETLDGAEVELDIARLEWEKTIHQKAIAEIDQILAEAASSPPQQCDPRQ